jgi:hypothetical protein
MTKDEKFQMWLDDNYKHMERYRTKEGKWKFNQNQFNINDKTYGYPSRRAYEAARENRRREGREWLSTKTHEYWNTEVKDIRRTPKENGKKERWLLRKDRKPKGNG